jgi:hypothetical protein
MPLSFSAGSGQLTASSPLNANVAPPGYCMLFIADSAGVPSVATILWVGSTTPPAAALSGPAADRYARPAADQRELRRAGDREHRGDDIRLRRHGGEGPVLQRRDQAR